MRQKELGGRVGRPLKLFGFGESMGGAVLFSLCLMQLGMAAFFKVKGPESASWAIYLFAVSLAVSHTGPAGPYTLLPDSNTPLINRTEPGNRSWIENPIVTPLPSKRFAAMFDWVQGGGQPAGSPLPYLGFAWSPDG